MKIKVLNNWKFKRYLSNGFWYKRGFMFPWTKRQFLQLGLFGFIFLFQWGSYE